MCCVVFGTSAASENVLASGIKPAKINAALDKDTTLRSDLLLIKTTLFIVCERVV